MQAPEVVTESQCWSVELHGKTLATLVGRKMTEAEARDRARFHWPEAVVKERGRGTLKKMGK